MAEANSWHGGRLQPRRVCVRWGPSPLPQKGQRLSPILRVEVENLELKKRIISNNSYAHDDQGDNPGQENRGLHGVLYKL